MAIIASRKPYKVTQNLTALNVEVSTYVTVEPPSPDHVITKSSYTGSAIDLTIDVAPFVKSWYGEHILVPQPFASVSANSVNTGDFPDVKLDVNGVVEYHKAVYGYREPLDEYYYDHWQTVKAIAANTNSYITLPPGVYDVTWTTSDYQTVTEQTTSASYPNVVQVAHPSLDLSIANTLKINANNIDYKYNISCPYMDGTIGFVNAIGMWEFFDVLGRQDYTWNRESTTYIPYSTGESKMLNTNGKEGVRVNTGWVDQEFKRVVEELLMSDYIVWYKGDSWDNLILDTNGLRQQLQRTDKMMNYVLNFTYSAPLIPIV